MRASVIGLGYVGLPLAIRLTQIGINVTAIDKNVSKITQLKKGILPFAQDEPYLQTYLKKYFMEIKFLDLTENYEFTDFVFVTIDTPLKGSIPDNRYILNAIDYVSNHQKKNSIVIIESTVAPKTAENIIIPRLEKNSGMKLNKDFFLAVAPERIRPKHIFAQLTTLPRVIGVSSSTIIPKLKSLYEKITAGQIDFTDFTTAEVVKTVENSFRDVNIAFANEIALACEELKVNVWEVRDLVNKIPFHDMHKPGSGVGGHCIPKDPWLLSSSVKKHKLNLIRTARTINDDMPKHIFLLTKRAFTKNGINIKKANLAILGYSYVENSDDTRSSPTNSLVRILTNKKIKFRIYDPLVKKYADQTPEEVVKNSDAIILMVAHNDFRKLDLKKLSKVVRTKILIDGRNFFDKKKVEKLGFTYSAVGNVPK